MWVFAVFDGNPHPAWDTTEDESPLSSRPVVFRPYILHGAYWCGSGYFRGNRCRARTFGGGWLAPGIACMRPSALGLWPVSCRLLSPPSPARFCQNRAFSRLFPQPRTRPSRGPHRILPVTSPSYL